jgi:hypothetical protein
VLRRYLAGHSVLGDFVLEEAERRRVAPSVLRRILRSQAVETDRVLALISAAYLQEVDSVRSLSSERRRAERVRRLLDGELLDPGALEYELDRWHVGLLLQGPVSDEAVTALAAQLAAGSLAVEGDDGLLWGWIGLQEKPELERLVHASVRSGTGGRWRAGRRAQWVAADP